MMVRRQKTFLIIVFRGGNPPPKKKKNNQVRTGRVCHSPFKCCKRVHPSINVLHYVAVRLSLRECPAEPIHGKCMSAYRIVDASTRLAIHVRQNVKVATSVKEQEGVFPPAMWRMQVNAVTPRPCDRRRAVQLPRARQEQCTVRVYCRRGVVALW